MGLTYALIYLDLLDHVTQSKLLESVCELLALLRVKDDVLSEEEFHDRRLNIMWSGHYNFLQTRNTQSHVACTMTSQMESV